MKVQQYLYLQEERADQFIIATLSVDEGRGVTCIIKLAALFSMVCSDFMSPEFLLFSPNDGSVIEEVILYWYIIFVLHSIAEKIPQSVIIPIYVINF